MKMASHFLTLYNDSYKEYEQQTIIIDVSYFILKLSSKT